MNASAKKALILISGTAVAILIAGTMSLTVSRNANASPAFAASTGKACGFCHQNPAGGGKLTSAGAKFKANGNKM